ncbi:MAG: hypothetical protein ABMB14_33575, partial [Myxococcota bacterium]
PAPAKPQPDSLGGLTLGTRINTTGWPTYNNGPAYKITQIAGEKGAIGVTLCNGVAHKINFQVGYTNNQLRVTDVTLLSDDPSDSAHRSYLNLSASLREAGWTSVSEDGADRQWIAMTLYKDGNTRVIQDTCMDDPDFAILGKYTCTVNIFVESTELCTQGL